MTSGFPTPGPASQQPIQEIHLPVAVTCLQWDCDGALNDEDREWMLQKLSSQQSIGAVFAPWLRRHGL